MDFKEIGTTGLKIPAIIFGTSALGNLYHALDFNIKLEIVKECLNSFEGQVVFDSAGKYGAGLALEELGKILNKLKADPDRVILSNKLGWLRTPLTEKEPTFEKGVWCEIKNDAVQDISYHGILKCWEQGNELLGGKYLPQLLSVHDPDEYLQVANNEKDRKKRFQDIIEAYNALSELKANGKIKAIGVGAKNWKIIREIHKQVKLDWVMFANSMTIMRHPKDLIQFMEELHQMNIGIINSAVFHAGFLTGGDYFDYKLTRPETLENKAIFKWREDFFNICNQFKVRPSDACVAFGMTPPGVLSISLNSSKPDRIKNNIDSVTIKILEEFWKKMKALGLIDREYPYV